MILELVITVIIIGLYFLHLNYKYWIDRDVPGPKPTLFIGNLKENFFIKKSVAEVYSDIYRQFQDAPFVGIFRASTPTLILRDTDLIKEITVKSFQHFHDNDLIIDKNIDPLLGRNPFFLRGDEWKTARTLLTPSFTSGKMKMMYPLLEENSKNFVKYIEKHPTATSGEGCHIKELCMRFTLNNVGNCAFGLDARCFEEENPEFKQIADRFFKPERWQTIKIFIVSVIPFLSKLFSIKFTPGDVEDKIIDMVTQTVRYREENNIIQNDILHVMHEMTKTVKDFTILDAAAHAAGFFVDGHETSSIVMHFLLYELAAHPEAQFKLREEVSKAFEENNGSLPYEELQKLSYLDAVLNEALRLHPAAGSLNKICTKPYTYIPKDNDVIKKPFVIEAETPIIIPLYALQRDPKYFDDPDDFKPERFLDPDNSVSNYTFLPFGQGPRACLGRRFGILQIKIGVAYVIRNFEISVNKKTKLPLKYDPLYFLTLPKDSLWLDFAKIY